MSNKTGLLKASLISCALSMALSPAIQADQQNDRFIIQFKDGRGNAGRGAVNAAGASVALELNNHNAVAARIPAAALNGLRNNPNIEFIEEDAKRYPLATNFTPEVSPYGIAMVQADLVAEAATSNIGVCIIDSGLERNHAEFAGQTNITSGPDRGAGSPFTDGLGHGTHVAGTVAAMGGNGEGVVGVNQTGALDLHIVKVFSDTGSFSYSSGLVQALDDCEAAGASVVSMSLGGSLKSRTEDRAFKAANDRGVLSIAAAGNDGNTRHSYPASYNSVISVAAIDANQVVADFSQQTSQVELAAPGVSVLSSVPTGSGNSTAVDVAGNGYDSSAMDGSPFGTGAGTLIDCGLGTSTCTGANGNVCLIQRGDIAFADKVLACEAGGGDAAIIYNNEPGMLLGTLGETATSIPSVGVSDTDGAAMVAALGSSASVNVQADDYAYFDGTSMATPHVSGVAALVWNNNETCSNEDIRTALAETAVDLGDAGRDNAYGFGLVQADAAMAFLGTDCGGGSGGGGGGGGSCELLPVGASCTSGDQCCSGSCKGKPGGKTCK
jgi:subtilisin family serine protease